MQGGLKSFRKVYKSCSESQNKESAANPSSDWTGGSSWITGILHKDSASSQDSEPNLGRCSPLFWVFLSHPLPLFSAHSCPWLLWDQNAAGARPGPSLISEQLFPELWKLCGIFPGPGRLWGCPCPAQGCP